MIFKLIGKFILNSIRFITLITLWPIWTLFDIYRPADFDTFLGYGVVVTIVQVLWLGIALKALSVPFGDNIATIIITTCGLISLAGTILKVTE